MRVIYRTNGADCNYKEIIVMIILIYHDPSRVNTLLHSNNTNSSGYNNADGSNNNTNNSDN